jgi:exodeoxyribonuclease VII large subunit
MDNLLYLKNYLDDCVSQIDINVICGEITSIKNKNPHQYIDIKYNGISMSCCSWGVQHNFTVGDNVKIFGSCSLSKFNLSIQFIIKKIELLENQKDTEHLKIIELENKLKLMGMIGNEKKKIISCPIHIGLITSTTGAVINDIKYVFNNEKLFGTVYIYNVLVQGDKCSKSICDAIDYFNDSNVDIILIARGGGEKEHIACFSNENMLLKVHQSKKITCCAIGHENDNPLINYVSDFYESTPTNLSHFVIKVQQKYLQKLNTIKLKIVQFDTLYEESKQKFKSINYDSKIKSLVFYQNIKLLDNVKKNISKILYDYEKSKNYFINQLQELRPSIYKNDVEIFSVEQLKQPMKKLKIKCIDGDVYLQYQIKNDL